MSNNTPPTPETMKFSYEPPPPPSGSRQFWNKTGRISAKLLGIKLDTEETDNSRLTRGESVISAYGESLEVPPNYFQADPTTEGWIREQIPSPQEIREFAIKLFPFTRWIGRYNLAWFWGDLVAGVTVGAVVVPQGMAYAKLAELPAQYGLYSSFFGVMIYWIFATSKDITIGPVAVMSTLMGNIVLAAKKSHPDISPEDIANALAIITGAVVFTLGITRLGFIVEFIPLTSIAAYMTGSAINIAVGQVPNLMGITGFNSRANTYEVIINILKHLGRSNLNAAIGLTSLFLLYFIRWTCGYIARKYPKYERIAFFANCLRSVFVILLYTLISWLVNKDRRKDPKFSILGTVPRGLKDVHVPKIDHHILSAFSTQLPAVCIVVLIEHIAISKSFGRVNNYVINPSQELMALGIANIFGAFFGAYPATGSFSRTAIKAKAGVRTPLSGIITGVVVILAIYALPAVFFYISNANLAAIIIHAVGDLITSPNTLYSFWRVNPLEVVIFFAGVIVTVFSTIENGIYTTIAVSGGLMLYRIAKARGAFLGRVQIHSLNGNDARDVWLPLDHKYGSNPNVRVEEPWDGVFVYQFTESIIYPNTNHYTDELVTYILSRTRRTNPTSYASIGDRPWNDPGPSRSQIRELANNPVADTRPNLKAVILDFSSVTNVDVTSVQNLVDVRRQLDRHASPDIVEWHFAGVRSPWARRALASVGFGKPSGTGKTVFSVAEVGGVVREAEAEDSLDKVEKDDLEIGESRGSDSHQYYQEKRAGSNDGKGRTLAINSVDRPFFHVDVEGALRSVLLTLGQDPDKILRN